MWNYLSVKKFGDVLLLPRGDGVNGSKVSSKGFLEDTLQQCLVKLAEQRSALDSYLREKQAEIERARSQAVAEMGATEAIIAVLEQQLQRFTELPSITNENEARSFPASPPAGSSNSRRIVELTRQMLASEGRPLSRNAILERLRAGDFNVPSTDLPGLVTKALARSGEFRVEKRHYWFADRPLP